MLEWFRVVQAEVGDLANMGASESVLVDLAMKLDRMVVEQRKDATEMARRFSDYANKVDLGYVYSPPTDYSTLRDVARRADEYGVLRDQFVALFLAVTGKRVKDVLARLSSQPAEASS